MARGTKQLVVKEALLAILSELFITNMGVSRGGDLFGSTLLVGSSLLCDNEDAIGPSAPVSPYLVMVDHTVEEGGGLHVNGKFPSPALNVLEK